MIIKLKQLSILFLTLCLIGVSQAETSNSGVGGIQDLSSSLGLGGGQEDEILEPDVAFVYSAEQTDGNTVKASWQIAKDHYMYRDKFKFEIIEGEGVSVGAAQLPPGKTKHDEFFGKIQVFYDGVSAIVPLSATKDTTAKLRITYQGCAEKTGICYPPIKKILDVNVKAGAAPAVATTTAPATATQTDTFVSEQDKSTSILASGDVIEILIYFFLGGLALAFTACMYPMIPILSSIIVGHGESVTRAKAFSISMAYVQSMAITFGIMGALVGAFGQGLNIQAWFQQPAVLIIFALVFVALAFSMFGFYNIQMPASIQGKLSNFSNTQKGGSLHGAIFMGAASALIIGPCAGPVIIGALAYVAAESDWKVGFLSMFIMGNGLGLPLLMVGTLGGHVLPKAGTWMDTVKAGAGVVLLAIALLFLERISFISATTIMLLWSALFIVIGVYMGALDPIKENVSGWFKLWKGLGVVFIVYGVIVMLGGLTGARNFNDPLHGSTLTMGGSTVEKEHLKFKRIKSDKDLQKEIAAAKAAGKYVMLDFYADWCTYCKQFEDYVFSNKDVQSLLVDFVLLQADVTANDEQDQALNKYTGVQAPPAILFYGPDGNEFRKYRIVGAMNAKQFIDRVNLVLKAK